MGSILTSCMGHGTVVARLKEGWQHGVLLKAHWTRTRCKAGDSRERGCWRLWQPRDPRGHSAAAANRFVSAELKENPPHLVRQTAPSFGCKWISSLGAITASGFLAPNAVPFFRSPNIRHPL